MSTTFRFDGFGVIQDGLLVFDTAGRPLLFLDKKTGEKYIERYLNSKSMEVIPISIVGEPRNA